MDELKNRRDSKDINQAHDELVDAILKHEAIDKFNQWLNENNVDCSGEVSSDIVSSIIGAVIGNWLDTGLSPDLVKEYFARFTDMVVELTAGEKKNG